MRSCLQQLFPSYEVNVFDGASEMIRWLKSHLRETILICLDHDLGANRIIDGNLQDPGTGRDVADYLSEENPCCSVLIHSSNAMAAPGMMMVLEDAGCTCSRLSPYNDLEWVQEAWIPELKNYLESKE
jgi:hypothetical protein